MTQSEQIELKFRLLYEYIAFYTSWRVNQELGIRQMSYSFGNMQMGMIQLIDFFWYPKDGKVPVMPFEEFSMWVHAAYNAL